MLRECVLGCSELKLTVFAGMLCMDVHVFGRNVVSFILHLGVQLLVFKACRVSWLLDVQGWGFNVCETILHLNVQGSRHTKFGRSCRLGYSGFGAYGI